MVAEWTGGKVKDVPAFRLALWDCYFIRYGGMADSSMYQGCSELPRETHWVSRGDIAQPRLCDAGGIVVKVRMMFMNL